jgi:hypothetical protein
MRAHSPGYDNASTLAWSRSVAAPLTFAPGRLPGKWLNRAQLEVDPACGLVTCFKPADDCTGRTLVRLWKTSEQSSAMVVRAPAFVTAKAADLLERERNPLEVREGHVAVPVRALGFAAIILER